jgi:hypothetical protein
MRNLKLILIFLIIASFNVTIINAQNQSLTYFKDISNHPETISEEAILAKLVDALGFRFYWSTEDLREEDLRYKPTEDSRSTEETISHILDLSNMVVKAIKPAIGESSPINVDKLTTIEKRNQVLENLFQARNYLINENGTISNVKIVLQRQNGNVELPVWNLINGPLSDALWHCGQIASFRRASGNPINPKINHLLGKLR